MSGRRRQKSALAAPEAASLIFRIDIEVQHVFAYAE
jgi:hypothetical protein